MHGDSCCSAFNVIVRMLCSASALHFEREHLRAIGSVLNCTLSQTVVVATGTLTRRRWGWTLRA